MLFFFDQILSIEQITIFTQYLHVDIQMYEMLYEYAQKSIWIMDLCLFMNIWLPRESSGVVNAFYLFCLQATLSIFYLLDVRTKFILLSKSIKWPEIHWLCF